MWFQATKRVVMCYSSSRKGTFSFTVPTGLPGEFVPPVSITSFDYRAGS